jgi:starch-binding outer membrane protein, SusD/RagB family
MKNSIISKLIWLLVIPLLVVTFSCTEKLDIKPKQSIDATQALTTPENIQSVLVGAYLTARNANLFGSSLNEFSELLATSTDMRFIGTYQQPREIMQKSIAVTNSYVANTWINAYELINVCNLLLDAETLAVLDDADRDRISGEARFLRGWIYFELAKLYGLPYEPGSANSQLAVPLIITPTKDATDAIKVPRNTVGDVYAQVLTDLTVAKDLLPLSNGVYADAYAASAVLARVYLMMSEFEDAAIEANFVIEQGGYSLMEHPLDAFNNNENCAEDIFSLQNNVASNTSWLTVMYASLNGMGRGDYEIQPAFLARFDSDDLRGELDEDTESFYTVANLSTMYYIGVGTILNDGGINSSKWADYYANIPLIRLAEMYLIRAEANFEGTHAQVGPNTPTEDINVIRARAEAPLYTDPVTQDQIREERYLELCWEGHRLHDLKRWNLDIGTVPAGEFLPYDAGNLILPIPFREIEVNDLLEQNTWYVSSK